MQDLNKVKGYRAMAGLTQEQMAEKIGISARSYATKEADVSKFTVSELEAMVKALNEKNLNIRLADLV